MAMGQKYKKDTEGQPSPKQKSKSGFLCGAGACDWWENLVFLSPAFHQERKHGGFALPQPVRLADHFLIFSHRAQLLQVVQEWLQTGG